MSRLVRVILWLDIARGFVGPVIFTYVVEYWAPLFKLNTQMVHGGRWGLSNTALAISALLAIHYRCRRDSRLTLVSVSLLSLALLVLHYVAGVRSGILHAWFGNEWVLPGVREYVVLLAGSLLYCTNIYLMLSNRYYLPQK